MFGIRSVNVRTLERPGFWRGEVVRYLVMVGELRRSADRAAARHRPLAAVRPGATRARLAGSRRRDLVRGRAHTGSIPMMRSGCASPARPSATNLQDERPALPSLATPATPGRSGRVHPRRAQQRRCARRSPPRWPAARPRHRATQADPRARDALRPKPAGAPRWRPPRPARRRRVPSPPRRVLPLPGGEPVRAHLGGAGSARRARALRGHPPRHRRDGRRRGRRPAHRTITGRRAGRARNGPAARCRMTRSPSRRPTSPWCVRATRSSPWIAVRRTAAGLVRAGIERALVPGRGCRDRGRRHDPLRRPVRRGADRPRRPETIGTSR